MTHSTVKKAEELYRYAGWTGEAEKLYPGLRELAPDLKEGFHLPECLVNDLILRDRLGGKAVGLLRLEYVRKQMNERYSTPELEAKYGPIFEIPKYKFFGTDHYKDFMARNGLSEQKLLSASEEERNRLFEEGSFTKQEDEVLKALFKMFRSKPVAIRSSGRYEYRKGTGYYGRFETKFLANTKSEEEDYQTFVQKVKQVYASTWSDKAIAYRNEKGIKHGDDWMGLVFQEMVGKWRDIKGRKVYAPDVSGVVDYDPYKPVPFYAENFGLNTLTMEGYCIQDVTAGRRSPYNVRMEYDSSHSRCQALNENSEIEEFTLHHPVFAFDREVQEMNYRHSPFRSSKRNKELDQFEKMGRIDILRLLLSHPPNGLQFTFEKTSGILDEPQRIEYSSVDGKLYLYQYSISATLLDRLKNTVDTSEKGVILAKDTDTENIIGHGEFTGPVVWVKRVKCDSTIHEAVVLHRKVLEEAEAKFPEGYLLIVEGSQREDFALGLLRGELFDASESDRVIAVDDKGFVLQDTQKDKENRGTRRIEYPHVKGLLVYPPKEFSSSGHHLEGVIEANTLCMSAPFDAQQSAAHFEDPQSIEVTFKEAELGKHAGEIVEKTRTLGFEVRVSKKPMRIAVDGLNKKAVLHTAE
ncbi:MAG: hypothetical protein FJY77_05730 [Candidatus Altiarchaeales archaeon]|nr:hypothetical protein [Candidatus Altiarchaeales archaeon]